MRIIIVGCGRVGVELALSLADEHVVTVIDTNAQAFDRLGADFRGRTVQGEGFDEEVLRRAGIETTDALAAVTSSDNVNVVVARMAREVYHIDRVVARVYQPRRIPTYEKFGLQTVASSSWGANRIAQLLVHPGLQSIGSVGNGEVQIYEITVPEAWRGRRLDELLPEGQAIGAAFARGGRGELPDPGLVLQPRDVLHVSVTRDGLTELRRRILQTEAQ